MDAEKNGPPLAQISDEDLTQFFTDRHANKPCSCCGNMAWHRLIEPLVGYNYRIPPFFVGSGFKGLEVVTLYCINCGFVRQHAAHLIRVWKEENGRK